MNCYFVLTTVSNPVSLMADILVFEMHRCECMSEEKIN